MTNMRIWNAVSSTDPAHTKKVNIGRGFTSIDAHWQIMQATRQFGPIGEGWGYSVEHSTISLSEQMVLAVADVTIWWAGDVAATGSQQWPAGRATHTYGPIRATCEMWSPDRSGKMRVDEDSPKKSLTDALTKGLSHLGFSADVFLGLFDDNRYVQKVAREFAAMGSADALNTTPSAPEYAPDEDVLAAARRWVGEQGGVLATLVNRADVLDWNKRNARALQKLQKADEGLFDKIMVDYDTAFRRTAQAA